MGALVTGFTLLLAKIAAVLSWIAALAVAAFVGLWDMLRDAACWLMESGLAVAVSAVNSLDMSGITAGIASYGAIPAELLNILGLLKVGTCIAIITSAIMIRLTLQLIPFVRLGS